MKILIDLNIILDMLQHRQPHYAASAQLLNRVVKDEIDAVIPGHCITTLYYIISKHDSHQIAMEVIDWLLNHFKVAPSNEKVFFRAKELAFEDYEDGVVAAMAEAEHCDVIITRNLSHFSKSEVPVKNPSDFLAERKSF